MSMTRCQRPPHILREICCRHDTGQKCYELRKDSKTIVREVFETLTMILVTLKIERELEISFSARRYRSLLGVASIG